MYFSIVLFEDICLRSMWFWFYGILLDALFVYIMIRKTDFFKREDNLFTLFYCSIVSLCTFLLFFLKIFVYAVCGFGSTGYY